ncbi:hypothetical protein 12R [Ranavirus ambystoma1]|uniref:Uncharacterized protein n=1 Tax=Ranavirus ambystoma1 TaxID=265294 RepID=A0A0U2RIL2_9VIRU|nr:hypothetical protein 12R [Ambystoma tigrinum virus]ALN36604.1 hypothetical protein 13R [Ambystoma tigrinum virus]ALN36810.1 hypothetical protein 11R [Ambystoma tigrinum virus]ALN37014.1 hypothetical protein 13R [Ambystoma tigrinum virus]ALN37314.1 hypothetical protein 13R [Ambystoma tigrinum virus]
MSLLIKTLPLERAYKKWTNQQ